VDYANAKSRTLLMRMATRGKVNAVGHLLQCGASLRHRDHNGVDIITRVERRRDMIYRAQQWRR
jgi:hypothetical protein